MVQVSRRKRRIGVNERGRPVGESHALCKLTDEDIELIHQLREPDPVTGRRLSYREIAAKFDAGVSVSKSHVRRILNGERRGQMPVRFKACT